MKRVFSRCIIAVILVGGIALLGLAARWLFADEEAPYSKYDETYVAQSEPIILGDIGIEAMQSKVVDYAKTCKSIDSLIGITYYLNQDYELTGVRFSYYLSDVENYSGYLEIICDKSGSDWEIQSANSVYNYGSNLYNLKYHSTTDAYLKNKINAITEYISNAEKGDFDIYLISLGTDSVRIDAHNNDITENTKGWMTYCKIVNENGEINIVEEN